MDTGLGMEGWTDGHRTKNGRWDRWVVGQMVTGLGMDGGQIDTRLGMNGEHRTRDGRWDRWTQD